MKAHPGWHRPGTEEPWKALEGTESQPPKLLLSSLPSRHFSEICSSVQSCSCSSHLNMHLSVCLSLLCGLPALVRVVTSALGGRVMLLLAAFFSRGNCRLPRVTQQSQDLILSSLILELPGKPLSGLSLLICELWSWGPGPLCHSVMAQ